MPLSPLLRGVGISPEKVGALRSPLMKQDSLAWYPWYWQDWRSNRKVQRMTVTERGIYRELLDECWCEGSLPPEPSALAEIARCTLPEMEAAWPALASCFVPRPDGRLVNTKIATVLMAQREAYERRTNAGRKAGLASAESRRTNRQPSSTTVNHKSRVETTLTTGQAALPSGASVPVSGKRIAAPPFESAPDPMADVTDAVPMPEEISKAWREGLSS